MRGLDRRLQKLERAAQGRTGGGVVLANWSPEDGITSGPFLYQGKPYANMNDLPPGNYLVVPEPVSAKEWEALAVKQQAASMGKLS
ncbi:MAG: hypothetical protein ACTSU8_05675 [Alphaproteobacteria bacterium]